MAIGRGCMSIGIADVYTSRAQDETKAVELIRPALDLGINFLDTALPVLRELDIALLA